MGFLSKLVGGVASATGLDDVFSIFKPKKPKYPKIPEPQIMPMADDETQKRARRRSIAAQLARKGRASTIMSQDRETLG